MTSSELASFIRTAIARGFADGAALTVTTTAALMALSSAERGSPWPAINSICHIVDGDEREFSDGFDVRDSGVALAINGGVMTVWSVLHALAFGRKNGGAVVAAGMTTAVAAYAIDYFVVPKRFTPGIEKKLSPRSIFLIYLVFGLTLGATGMLRRPK